MILCERAGSHGWAASFISEPNYSAFTELDHCMVLIIKLLIPHPIPFCSRSIPVMGLVTYIVLEVGCL